MGVVEALHGMAAHSLQQLCLHRRLHSLGNHLHVQLLCHIDDCLQDDVHPVMIATGVNALAMTGSRPYGLQKFQF